MTTTETATLADLEILTWSDDFLLGNPGIDGHHAEFVHVLQQLQQCPNAALAAQLQVLHTHLQAHFGSEDQLMVSTEFPPRDCHMQEHAAVMQSVQDMQARLADTAEAGDSDALEQAQQRCRDLVQALAEWFPKHTQHLDSALAHWVAKKTLGGKPVIIKRGLNLR